MGFSIIGSDRGSARVVIDGTLDDGSLYVLRIELATLLRGHPERVQLSIKRPHLIDDSSRGLLVSFLDLLHAQGGRLVLCELGGQAVEIVERPQIDRLLRRQSSSLGAQ